LLNGSKVQANRKDIAEVWSSFLLAFIYSIIWGERGKGDAKPIYEGKCTMRVTAIVCVAIWNQCLYSQWSLEVFD